MDSWDNKVHSFHCFRPERSFLHVIHNQSNVRNSQLSIKTTSIHCDDCSVSAYGFREKTTVWRKLYNIENITNW